jgi:hypothetical protein
VRAKPISLLVRLPGALFALGCVIAAAPTAHAASRVVLLRTANAEELLRKAETLLQAELRAAGFDVDEVERSRAADPRADVEAAGGVDPIAVVALVMSVPGGTGKPGAEVWISDRVTGKLVVRGLRIAAGTIDAAAADLALRAVELLRGSLLEIKFEKPRPAVQTLAPPPDVARFVDDVAGSEARAFAWQGLGLGVGAVVLWGLGELDPAWAPTARLSYGTRPGRALRVAFAGPSASHEILADEGSARMRQMLFTLDGLLTFRPDRRLQPYARVGVGLHHLRVEGTGKSSLFPGHTRGRLVPFALAGGGLALRLGRIVSLVAEAELCLGTRATVITISDVERARFDRAFLGASLGLLSAF